MPVRQRVEQPEGFDRLVEGRTRFVDFVARRVGSRDVAEDIVQAAYVRGLGHKDDLRDETVVAWFYRVLRNAIADHYRTKPEIPATLPEPDRREVCECIMGLLDDLKPEYRQAIERIDINEGSLRELADSAGITPDNAAVRVHRARAALRKKVVECCGSCSEHGCVNCSCKATPRSGAS